MDIKVDNNMVPSLKFVDLADMEMPLAIIYKEPRDFPGMVVARIWEGKHNLPTNVCCLYQTVEEAKGDLAEAGFFMFMPRSETDDPCIVETWVKGKRSRNGTIAKRKFTD